MFGALHPVVSLPVSVFWHADVVISVVSGGHARGCDQHRSRHAQQHDSVTRWGQTALEARDTHREHRITAHHVTTLKHH